MDDCIFCKIIKGELPSYKIYEDDYVYAFLDISGDYYGHTLVIPKKHSKNILEMDSSDLERVMNVVQKISQHYVNDCHFEGVNILNLCNECAGQTVMHTHIHIIPRTKNDGYKIFNQTKLEKFDLELVKKELEIN